MTASGPAPIDRDGSQPPYRQAAADLIRRVRAGEFEPGSRFPPLSRITQEYELSLITARKARALVLESGYVTEARGWGTFVAERESWPEGK